jgi:uncharacterized protein YyaL (SSP411 family)
VVIGDDQLADELHAAASATFSLTKSVLRYKFSDVTANNLPPALAETIAQLPGLRDKKSMAVICSGFACQAPIHSIAELSAVLEKVVRA